MTLFELQSLVAAGSARKFKIVFPIQSLASGDRYINLHIDLTNGIADPNSYEEYTYNSDTDFGIYIMGDDVDEVDFDDRQFWILLRKKPFEFQDRDNILMWLLAHPSCYIDQVEMEYYFRKPSDQDFPSTPEFKGYLNQDNIVYNNYQGHLQCEFYPQIYILGQIKTFLPGFIQGWDNDSPPKLVNIAPIFNTAPWRDGLGALIQSTLPYTANITSGPVIQNCMNCIDLITAIYKIIDPNVTLSWLHDWVYCQQTDDPYGYHGLLNDLYYHIRFIFGNYDGGFNFVPNSYTDLMKILKALSFDLGCITGLLSNDKAIFYPFLNILNSNNQIYIADDFPFSYEQKINYNTIKYLTLFYNNSVNAGAGDVNAVDEEILQMNIYGDVFRILVNGTFYNLPAIYSDLFPPDINGHIYTKTDFLTAYWSQYYLNPFNARTDSLKLPGIDWSMFNKLLYKGINYLIIKLTVNRSQNFTECECVPLIY